LDAVPERIARCAEIWRLTIGERLGHGNTSRVFACVDRRGRPVVLKLAPPEMRPDVEAAALRVWGGHGAVRIVDFDPAAAALLLERLASGTPLPPGDDAAAVERAAAPLAAILGAPLPSAHPFASQLRHLESWLGRVRVSAEPGTQGARLLPRAEAAARRLCADTPADVLLHGDYIDKNLLLDGASYAAIDPIPHLGDPCSDVGFFAAYHPPATGIIDRAMALAARCGLDQERAARWAAVWAVGEATETWRDDSDDLQAWIASEAPARLLDIG
jgi:streptomycin 6-kinase